MRKKLLNGIIVSCLKSKSLRRIFNFVSEGFNGFLYGSYAIEDEAALAISFIQDHPAGVIVDAGANQGLYTQAILKSGVSFGKVLMIEPSPYLRYPLESLTDQSALVKFEPVAIGSEQGALDLYFDIDGSSLASFYQRDVSHVGLVMGKSVTVPVETLDHIATKYELAIIDYLKLDLEGHELQALIGAKQLLDEGRIRALSFEFGGCNIDSRTYVKDFWQLLVRQYDFSFYRIAPHRHLIRLSHYSEFLERFTWQNILACAPGVNPKWQIIE